MIIWYRAVFSGMVLFAILMPGQSHAGWMEKETEYTILAYDSMESLTRYYDAVDFGPGSWNQSASLQSEQEILKIAALKTDALFRRVQEILDMKKRIPKIRVRLFPDKKSLRRAYSDISSDGRRLRAWYLFRTNSVYLNVRDLHEGMLAHELAHGIIDHFLTVKPPANTAEILARYVDSHLK